MRAMRFNGRGRTEAPFSCLFGIIPPLNMLAIMRGSDIVEGMKVRFLLLKQITI